MIPVENQISAIFIGDTAGTIGTNDVFCVLQDNLIEARYHYLEARRLIPNNELVRDNLTKLCRIDTLSAYCQETFT